MSETKPEPVAWAVMPTPSQDLDLWVVHRQKREAENEAGVWRAADHEDVQARPLYDADVPALVEALREAETALESSDCHCIADTGNVDMHTEHCGLNHARQRIRTVLATLDTEEGSAFRKLEREVGDE